MKPSLLIYVFSVILMSVLFVSSVKAISIDEILKSNIVKDKALEGYATPSFKELYRSFIMLGGMDVHKPKVLTEYIRLVYCNLYKENYSNDYMWNDVSKRISSRIIDKRESYKVLYEVSVGFNLERYNFNKEYFPISKKRSMFNIISMTLTDFRSFTPYCENNTPSDVFIPVVTLQLYKPLSIDKVRIPVDYIKKILVHMNASQGGKKMVYGRIRFRVFEAPGFYVHNGKPLRAELRGEVTSVDFFYDSELTKPILHVKGYF